jgi:hypothetical protein
VADGGSQTDANAFAASLGARMRVRGLKERSKQKVRPVSRSMAAASPDATPLAELGLPSWLDSMLQPGVGNGVFITLKASLVGLILTLLTMCYYIEDPVGRRQRGCCPGTLRALTPVMDLTRLLVVCTGHCFPPVHFHGHGDSPSHRGCMVSPPTAGAHLSAA